MHDLEDELRHRPSSSTISKYAASFHGDSTCSNAEVAKHIANGQSTDLHSSNETAEATSTLFCSKPTSSKQPSVFNSTSSRLLVFDAPGCRGTSTGEERNLKRPPSLSQHFSPPTVDNDGDGSKVRGISSRSSLLEQAWSSQPPRQLPEQTPDALIDLITEVEAGPNNFLLRRKSQSTSRTITNPLKSDFDLLGAAESSVSLLSQHQGIPSTGRRASFPVSLQHKKNETQSRSAGGEGMLPSIVDGDRSVHYRTRSIMSMATAEDANWLSDLQCFMRAEMLEVFRVGQLTPSDHHPRRKLFPGIVGIRCRFCAHLPKNARAIRSSAFPSKIAKIYQSFVMINREHFPKCPEVPTEIYNKFLELKDKKPPVRADVKNYWENSAQKLGLVDTGPEEGICVSENSIAKAAKLKPFRSEESEDYDPSSTPVQFLVNNSDRDILLDGESEYTYTLMLQTQVIHMTREEVKQKEYGRQTIQNENGFGCRHCCEQGWMGGSRFFPSSVSNLRKCMDDLHDHLQRCSLCPQAFKHKLAEERIQQQAGLSTDHNNAPRQRNSSTTRLLTMIWSRLQQQEKNI